MSVKIIPELSTSKLLQLLREIRNLIHVLTYEELKEDDNKWALDTSKVSRNWFNDFTPLIVSSLHHSVMVRFNSV